MHATRRRLKTKKSGVIEKLSDCKLKIETRIEPLIMHRDVNVNWPDVN